MIVRVELSTMSSSGHLVLVYECQRLERAFTSPVRTKCVLFCSVVSRRYINVCNCDMFSVLMCTLTI